METNIRIFLSYARQDSIAVEELYDKLVMEGFSPWMDKRDILPGEVWKESIQDAVRSSYFFFACLTQSSVNKRGMIQKEIKEALDVWAGMLHSDIYVVPVRLEDCKVPEDLGEFQWVNLFEDNGWEKLVRAIQIGVERRKNTQVQGVSTEKADLTSNDILLQKPPRINQTFRPQRDVIHRGTAIGNWVKIWRKKFTWKRLVSILILLFVFANIVYVGGSIASEYCPTSDDVLMVADSYFVSANTNLAKLRLTGLSNDNLSYIVSKLVQENQMTGNNLQSERLQELAQVLNIKIQSPIVESASLPNCFKAPWVVFMPSRDDIRMTADSFSLNGNVELAKKRLQSLSKSDLQRYLNDLTKGTKSPVDATRIRNLADALEIQISP